MTQIYVLIDPRTEEIRYVGKTVKSLKARVADHRRRFDWNPRIELVQEVLDDFWQEAERYWIAYYRSIGCDLVNVAKGGAGGGMIGRHHSFETRARVSAKLTGRVFTSEHRANISVGARARPLVDFESRSARSKKMWARRDANARRAYTEFARAGVAALSMDARRAKALKAWETRHGK